MIGPRPTVGIVDYGVGNHTSVLRCVRQLGFRARISQQPEHLDQADVLLLPGVGAFPTAMERLHASALVGYLQRSAQLGRPLIGICLGMQLLSTRGWEGAKDDEPTPGLNLIGGDVCRLEAGPDLPLPHVGWNAVEWLQPHLPLAAGFPPGGDLYFVHSYAFRCAEAGHSLARSDYGGSFSAVVGNPATNSWGMQFHPEKSQKLGRRLLENFLALSPC